MLPPYLTDVELDDLVRRALAEDIGSGDVTTRATIPPEALAEAEFLAKSPGIVAGIEVARRVFRALDGGVSLSWTVDDGARVKPGLRFGAVAGPARALLSGERVALNLLQRMSGIATATRAMVDAIGDRPTRLLDTRKTVPGLRALDKWAVLLGGGHNHRIGLYDQLLVKDNHIAACGGVREAIRAANAFRAESDRRDLVLEIEVRTLDELDEVLDCGAVDVILLDNMASATPDGTIDTSRLAEAVRRVGGRFRTEASGNVSIATVGAIAATGVQAVSSGALTHSVTALDISLEMSLAMR
jgi:nicotinate-nucleotide pyrophosphorylase (carboxylating)